MEKEFGKIKKNDNTEIIVRIDDFGGKPGLTIREFTTSERYTGFTKSGTRIAAESFKDFKAMINAIDEKDFAISETKQEKTSEAGPEKKPEPKKTPKPKKVIEKIQDVSDEDLL